MKMTSSTKNQIPNYEISSFHHSTYNFPKPNMEHFEVNKANLLVFESRFRAAELAQQIAHNKMAKKNESLFSKVKIGLKKLIRANLENKNSRNVSNEHVEEKILSENNRLNVVTN